MLMESVQGLSFSNVRTRRLEKVGELLDKQVTTSVEVSSPPLPAAIYSTWHEYNERKSHSLFSISCHHLSMASLTF